MTATTTTRRRTYAAIAIASLIAPVASCAANIDDDRRPASPTAAEEESPMSAPGAYANGEYSARGWYGSLPSHQDVTLTLEDGTVTGVKISTPAEDEVSLGYQQRFAEALPDAIVGRSLDDIDIDRLAGSSGCSEGFMSALDEIRADARTE